MTTTISTLKYLKALDWIAYNDEPNETDLPTISEMISVRLVADVFVKAPMRVAKDILAIRVPDMVPRKITAEKKPEKKKKVEIETPPTPHDYSSTSSIYDCVSDFSSSSSDSGSYDGGGGSFSGGGASGDW